MGSPAHVSTLSRLLCGPCGVPLGLLGRRCGVPLVLLGRLCGVPLVLLGSPGGVLLVLLGRRRGVPLVLLGGTRGVPLAFFAAAVCGLSMGRLVQWSLLGASLGAVVFFLYTGVREDFLHL